MQKPSATGLRDPNEDARALNSVAAPGRRVAFTQVGYDSAGRDERDFTISPVQIREAVRVT
jgi:hypothetical protein